MLVVIIMAGPFAFGEAEVLTFTQSGGEILKDAWYKINDSQKRATKKHFHSSFIWETYQD